MSDIDFLSFKKILKFNDVDLFGKDDKFVCLNNKIYACIKKYDGYDVKYVDIKLFNFLCENYTFEIIDNNHYIDIDDNIFFKDFFTLNGKAYSYSLRELTEKETLLYILLFGMYLLNGKISDEVKNFIEENTLPPK